MMDDMDGMDDVADGVEHLQRAAREMIAAARSFLDAVEAVVDDDERLRDVSTTVGDVAATVVESLRGAARREPWVDAAWRSDRPAATDPVGSHSEVIDLRAGGDAASGGMTDGTPEGPSDDTEEWARPLIDADAPRRPSRVRRIAVD